MNDFGRSYKSVLAQALESLQVEMGSDDVTLPLIDQDHGTVEEFCVKVIQLAIFCGWRGADAEDYTFLRTLVGDEPAYNGQPSIGILNARKVLADDMALAENLEWAADDAETWLNDNLAPESTYFGSENQVWGLHSIPKEEEG